VEPGIDHQAHAAEEVIGEPPDIARGILGIDAELDRVLLVGGSMFVPGAPRPMARRCAMAAIASVSRRAVRAMSWRESWPAWRRASARSVSSRAA